MIKKLPMEYLSNYEFANAITKKINELIDYVELHIKVSDHNFDVYKSRIETLEEKAILKPDYEPAEVGLNLVPRNGTFEWACMQMKKGRMVKRDGRPYTICLGLLYNKFEAHLGNECFDWNFSTSDILATDWDVVK